jgi:hypothetical protein
VVGGGSALFVFSCWGVGPRSVRFAGVTGAVCRCGWVVGSSWSLVRGGCAVGPYVSVVCLCLPFRLDAVCQFSVVGVLYIDGIG